MPRAILAMRRYPATLLLAMFLFLATLILTAGSLGTVISGGGDDGDGGSGIGGTGKSGEFGGSGFGGTGGPSPFFTSVEETSQEDEATPSFSNDTAGVELTAEIAQSLQQNVLSDETQRSIDGTVEDLRPLEPLQEPVPLVQVAEAVLKADTSSTRIDDTDDGPAPPLPADEAAPATVADFAVTAPASPSPMTQAPLVESVDAQRPPAAISVAAEPSAIPAERMTVSHEAEEEASQEALDRSSIPERIQRPDLPPFQRIRPVERPSLLPSRAQPMRI